MTNHLTDEQKEIGRANAHAAIGGLETGPRAGYTTRRDFLRAAGAAGAGLGALYFGYGALGEGIKPVRAVVIGTGNEGCDAMIRQHNRAYVDIIGYCDARPYNQQRALDFFARQDLGQYSKEDIANLKRYDTITEALDDPDVEAVINALPLWLHAPVSIDAMKKGKHVFCEKLMAHNITECKQMCRVARETNKVLGIGHQRHYSALYDNANSLITSGALGDIRHIRASWHRNNAQKVIAKNSDGSLKIDEATGDFAYERDDDGNYLYYDSWKPPYMDGDREINLKKAAYKALDGKTYSYDNHDELVRWRLYDKTGAGLMAELGSHQLDACSIFLGKKHPVAVTGFGGTYYYEDNREVDDHVFVNFEFPNTVNDRGLPADDGRVVVSYSSITTNAFEKYGEMVMGTYGTMIVEQEFDIYLYKENDRNRPGSGGGPSTAVKIEKSGGKAVLDTSPSAIGPTPAAALGSMASGDGYPPSRGYREELEHFAFCVRHGNESNYYDVIGTEDEYKYLPRCRGEVALADAVVALTSNLAMRRKQRIEFDPAWFDYESNEVPETSTRIARRS